MDEYGSRLDTVVEENSELKCRLERNLQTEYKDTHTHTNTYTHRENESTQKSLTSIGNRVRGSNVWVIGIQKEPV